MTSDQLSACSKKKLEALAKFEGIAGWKAMRKDQLVVAILRARKSGKKPVPVVKAMPPSKVLAKKPMTPIKVGANKLAVAIKTLPKPKLQKAAARDTSSNPSSGSLLEHRAERSKYDVGTGKDPAVKPAPELPKGYSKDRIVVMVRDPYWLHVYWELTDQSMRRAEAALGQDWHGAKHILRLVDVTANETTSTAEAHVRDIELHGTGNNWYVEVKNPPRSYRIDIGYVSKRGQFYAIVRSSSVTTPSPDASDSLEESESMLLDSPMADRIFALAAAYDPLHAPSSSEQKVQFEERLKKPVTAAPLSSAALAPPPEKNRKFWFQLDAELIVYGATEPTAKVTLQGEPVKLRPDGTFTMRFSLPDGRQIIPAVANSINGVDERTIVLAVERNTRALEPMVPEVDAAK
jgi:uncharacterized protein